jgi:phosphatidylserine/phosphatidylglycerophosphate/cardiolipin synthase-like enzyme
MAVELVVRPGVDSAFLAWRASFIENCRGFALARRIRRVAGSTRSPQTYKAGAADGFAEEWVSSWVGFAGGPETKPGERQPTTVWPIQKYLWSDFMVNPGDQVAYRVVPMVGTATSLKPLDSAASGWTPVVTIGAETPGQISCFFNRGIVASQWLARLLPQEHPDKALREIIATPRDATRNFLGGPAREKLIELLQQTNTNNGHIYAALFELNDPELIPLIQAFGKRAHIVLGNGSVKRKGDDENADARDALKMCDVRDRMTAPRALAHNKYLVLCDMHQTPQAVWTGSTNWTESGLCTQANNAVLIRNVALAHSYLEHWNALAATGDSSPPSLFEENGNPHTANGLDGTTLWFTPLHGQADLEQAGELIRRAKEGVLFLMFNPGPRGTLLSDIIDLALPSGQHYDPDLYIQGVVNQNPGTAKNPVTLFNRGEKIDSNSDVVLPAAIPGPLEYWVKELKRLPGTFAMVHSKVIVIDPYGEKPVVMTGSHNMGPKASGVNDENLLLIEGDGELASQYAGNIMQIYNQYRWRQSVMAQNGKPKWEGLEDDDKWQIQNPAHPNDYDKRRLRELDFWFGKPTVPAAHPVVADDTTDTDSTEDDEPPAYRKPTRRVAAPGAAQTTRRKPARATARKR